jgi:cytochrome P450
MEMGATSDGAADTVVYDPYDRDFALDPYAGLRRLRAEAPLYYNPERDFYALSRYDDVASGFVDKETFICGRGGTLDVLKSGMEIPPGTVLMEDPPAHTIHRKLLSRMFTPRRIAELEDRTRQYCEQLLDPLVGGPGFDFIHDIGKQVPTRVISMLVGIPQPDEEQVRDRFEQDRGHLDLDDVLSGETFAEYIDWRVEHPSDDIMSQLLYAEFEDEYGEVRRLTRQELLAYVNIVSLAGNETTRLLIGWMGLLLSDHPDQRRILVENPSLIPNAVEESLRYEPVTLHVARYVTRDVEYYGQTVPEGSIMALVVAAANRDEQQFDDPERFDVTREGAHHFTLGFGTHYCLGQALARLEARLVIEEVLKRFPDFEVDRSRAELRQGDVELRGWESLPVVVS